MNIDYYLINPTENITLLVETPVPQELQPFVASELLLREKRGEQVGFIRKSIEHDISVRMAGGEFCGNATISAAALYRSFGEMKDTVNVCLSGVTVPVRVFGSSNSKFKFGACLKNDAQISEVSFEYNGKSYSLPIVSFYGISHIIADKSSVDFSPEKVIKNVCRKINAEALGIMMFDFKSNFLTPLVFVPRGDTLYWENSCASGTAAIGAYLFDKTGKNVSLDIAEPGGTMNVFADKNRIVLSGNAVIECKKQADIEV